MFRTDRGIVQACGNRMCGGDLPMAILQNVGIRALQDARQATPETCSMLSQLLAAPAGFYADQLYSFVAEKFVKDSHGVGGAAHTGKNSGRQLAFRFQDLRPRLSPNDRMKITHHGGVRMS